MSSLAGTCTVVTGGASGIGEATVRHFARLVGSVVVADVDDERGHALCAEIGPSTTYVHPDVAREEHVARAVDLAVQRFGRLDCMFNNAVRVGRWQLIDDISVDEWDQMLAVLWRSVFLGIKHGARVMRPSGGGSIINTASTAAVQSGYGPHPYSAAKAAVVQLTRTSAVELAADRIRVNVVIPGGIATRINGHAAGLSGDALERSVERMRKGLSAFQPYPRAGEGDNVARAVAFLAGADAEFITGADLRVDGGVLAGRPFIVPPEPGDRARMPT